MNIITCRGCQKTKQSVYKPSQSDWGRKDAYGIFTGVYCEDCYNSNKYPYKKYKYHDENLDY